MRPRSDGRRRGGGLAVLLLVLPTLGGCYSYRPTELPVPAGQELRARLTPAGATWLFESFGRHRSEIDGTLVRTDPETFVLATWRTDLPGAARVRTSIDTLYIPRQHVIVLEERRLSVGRTVLASALAAGAVFVVARELTGVGGSGEGGDGGTQLMIPLRLLTTP